jgi:hypothetical protein
MWNKVAPLLLLVEWSGDFPFSVLVTLSISGLANSFWPQLANGLPRLVEDQKGGPILTLDSIRNWR